MAYNGLARHDSLRQRVSQRNSAIERVARLTTATAVVGTFATVGFSGLAALTYSGSPTSDSSAVTTDDQSSAGQGLGQSGGTAQVTPSPTRSTTQSGTATVRPPTTTTRGRTHAVTGGS